MVDCAFTPAFNSNQLHFKSMFDIINPVVRSRMIWWGFQSVVSRIHHRIHTNETSIKLSNYAAI